MKSYLIFILLFTTSLYSQKRYVITSNDEMIPVPSGQSALQSIRHVGGKYSPDALCGSKYQFGFNPNHGYPNNFTLGGKHHDVLAEWFVAKVTGTIDTLFWDNANPNLTYDSTISIRIFKSNITPGRGPGFSPYMAPCSPWGYYVNSNDVDQGIAPFRDEATDSNWVSASPGDSASFDPFGKLIWGHSGVEVHVGHDIGFVALADYDSLRVNVGDVFFVTMRIGSANSQPNPSYEETKFYSDHFRVSKDDEVYPSRDWKFYVHDSEGTCRGIKTRNGWYAQGGSGTDSLDVAVLGLWYTFTPTANVPPDVPSATFLHTTIDTSARTVNAEILDCDYEVPARAGVKFALIKWSINGTNQPDLPMGDLGGYTWSSVVPGEPVGSEVTYHVYAEDSTGLSAVSSPFTYRVVSPRSPFALVDTTSASCIRMSIAEDGGNVIPPASFYLPPGLPSSASALDDGTAGPFDMGSDMPLFGDVGRYLWIGVNGGVAISKSATDTVDVNSNGLFASSWTFPNSSPVRHGGRSDGDGKMRMPGNFFAPFWADLWCGDSVNGRVCGHVRFQRGFGGDSCNVIVEWDSVGRADLYGSPSCNELTFRVIFNKCDGTITYQYDELGSIGADPSGLIGFQADSTSLTFPSPGTCKDPPYLFVNQNGYPAETRPYNGACFTIFQAPVTVRLAGWNLISIGVIPPNHRNAKKDLYPDAISPAFRYRGSYLSEDTLTAGRGYWVKIGFGECAGVPGRLLHDIVDSIRLGWNLVGTIGYPVSTSSITPGGGVSLSSAFYVYDGSYHTTTTLRPGHGFWIRANSPGTLSLNGSVPAAVPKSAPSTNFASLNSITITDNTGRSQTLYLGSEESVKEPPGSYELPPAMPGFDARFASGGMLETYPARITGAPIRRYPIHIEAESYPLTIGWNIIDASGGTLTLGSFGKNLGIKVLAGAGSITVTDANLKDLYIELNGSKLPLEFALRQNYPNPFNPATEIRFSIRDAGKVTLRMFDVLGREVALLVNEEREPGEYTVSWDATNFASGMYFYELKSWSFRDVKKMVLVR